MPSDLPPGLPSGLPIAAEALPPFFHRLVTLDHTVHASLRLDPASGFGFARGANAIPLALGELAAAAQHYPIVFATGAQPMPLAVVGYRVEENLFVGQDGQWAAGRYVPAYLRAHPFLLVQQGPGQDEFVVAMEAGAEALGETKGDLLLQGGKPSPILEQRLALCRDLRASLVEAGHFAAALQAHGLLQEQEARLELNGQRPARLDGFRVLDPAGLQTLPDATVLAWHRSGWLAACQAAVFSTPCWAQLIEQAAARP